MSEYKALATPSFIIIGFALSFLAMPAYFIMKQHKVPVKESATLTILLMIGINYSSGLILKGISTIGKKEEIYKYQINTKTYYLKDPKNIAPPIKVWRYKDYWSQYDNESVQDIKMLKGPFDLWFYNRKDLENKYKKFYNK